MTQSLTGTRSTLLFPTLQFNGIRTGWMGPGRSGIKSAQNWFYLEKTEEVNLPTQPAVPMAGVEADVVGSSLTATLGGTRAAALVGGALLIAALLRTPFCLFGSNNAIHLPLVNLMN